MFVRCQCHVTRHKSEQTHSPLKFAAFHNQSPLLTMFGKTSMIDGLFTRPVDIGPWTVDGHNSVRIRYKIMNNEDEYITAWYMTP